MQICALLPKGKSLQVGRKDGKGLKSHFTSRLTWASPENPMKAFLYKTTTDGLKDLPRKVAMVRAKGTLDFAKGVS